MKCLLCHKMIGENNKYELCSACQSASLGTLIREGLIKIEDIRR